MQRSISVIMLVICLAGVVLLSAGRLLDGGQEMIKVSSSLSAAVVYGVIGATLANLAAIYAFHISDPDTMEEIETGCCLIPCALKHRSKRPRILRVKPRN